MGDDVDNEGRSAQRIGEDDDRWRCSLCGGYVRGNAPMCKHCHALFGAPEQLRVDDLLGTAGNASLSSTPLTSSQKVAAVMTLVLLIAVGVGCYLLAIRIGGYAGVLTGWTLAPALLTLVFFTMAAIFGRIFGEPERIDARTVIEIWLVLTLVMLPMSLFYLIPLRFTAWWAEPLTLGIILTLFATIAKGASLFPSPRSTIARRIMSLDSTFNSSWRKMMLLYVLPLTAVWFIAERWNLQLIYYFAFFLFINERFRAWLWQLYTALGHRLRGTSTVRE